MPTTPGAISTEALTPKQALEKVTGLITELGADQPETPEPETAQPEAVAEPAATETTPPASSDQPETPEPESPLEEVVVDGEPIEVSLAELKRNYSQHAHNTQRAQELSEKEKSLEPTIRQRVEAELLAERQQYQQGLSELRAALQKLNGEPNWIEKRKELSPEEFLKQKADWEASKANEVALAAEEQRVAQQNEQTRLKLYHEYLRAEEDKLRAAVPEWADVPKGKAEIAKLATFVRTTYGIPDATVANAFTSSAAILLARDAMRYRELHREPQPKPKQPGIKAAKPGTPERPRPNARQEALIAATKSGRSRDAAKAIEAMLGDD